MSGENMLMSEGIFLTSSAWTSASSLACNGLKAEILLNSLQWEEHHICDTPQRTQKVSQPQMSTCLWRTHFLEQSSQPSSTSKPDRVVPWFLHGQRRLGSQLNGADVISATLSSSHMPRMPTLWPVFQVPQLRGGTKFSHWPVGPRRVETKV